MKTIVCCVLLFMVFGCSLGEVDHPSRRIEIDALIMDMQMRAV